MPKTGPAVGAGLVDEAAEKTQAFFDKKTEDYPFVTPATWAFFDLLLNSPPDQLDFDAEWQKMVDDLNTIYNK